jgi:phosphopantothenoylcysteine decarboxylase/phosphopantothenate--cysteine ligase
MAERDEAGPGRLAEVPEIIAAARKVLAEARAVTPLRTGRPLAGRHVLVTSGPTHEPIDPVRYIANRSSGKQGHAIAKAAAAFGARVTLVSGPVALPDPAGVAVIHVETAEEMLQAVTASLPADIAVFAAAVADWRTASAPGGKIKKAGKAPALDLVENPDILATVAKAATQRPRLVIGFAAETGDAAAPAERKRKAKGADWIVGNDVSPQSGVFGGDSNTVHLVTEQGVEDWPSMSKDAVAERLMLRAAEHMRTRTAAAE